MPEAIKVVIGIFIVSFLATVSVYLYPMIGSKVFKTNYQITGKKFFSTLAYIFLILLLGFYLLMGGLSLRGEGGFMSALSKMQVSDPTATFTFLNLVLLIVSSFCLVAIPYALLGRMQGFTRSYLITVGIFAVILFVIVVAIDQGWNGILKPDVFRTIGGIALSFYLVDYFMKRNKSGKA